MDENSRLTKIIRKPHTNLKRLIVIKVGSSLLVSGSSLNQNRLSQLADAIAQVRRSGERVVLVSSGAMACGMSSMGIPDKRKDIPFKQAMASIGQVILMQRYSEAFARHDIPIAQVLLAPEDMHSRSKYLNAQNTFDTLLSLEALPIVNENDTVAVEEIRFGDNDRLSALVASLLNAQLLIILSDVDGLYTADPKKDQTATLVRSVERIDQQIAGMAGGEGSSFSTGGMKSKLVAAQIATLSGIGTIIASGRDFSILSEIMNDQERGTFFQPVPKAISSRKRWIGFGMIPQGTITVDRGAETALLKNKSLLPVGIIETSGHFEPGDCVKIRGEDGQFIARGLVDYSWQELSALKDYHINRLSGREESCPLTSVVIHANNLVLLPSQKTSQCT